MEVGPKKKEKTKKKPKLARMVVRIRKGRLRRTKLLAAAFFSLCLAAAAAAVVVVGRKVYLWVAPRDVEVEVDVEVEMEEGVAILEG